MHIFNTILWYIYIVINCFIHLFNIPITFWLYPKLIYLISLGFLLIMTRKKHENLASVLCIWHVLFIGRWLEKNHASVLCIGQAKIFGYNNQIIKLNHISFVEMFLINIESHFYISLKVHYISDVEKR